MSAIRATTLLVALSCSVAGSAAAGDLLVVRGPLPRGAAERLVKDVHWYGDFGHIGVAEGGAADAARLRAAGFDVLRLGPWQDHWRLAVALAGHAPADAQPLFAHGGQVLLALPPDRPVLGCAHEMAAVTRRPFRAGAGFRTPQGVLAMTTVDPSIAAMVAQVNGANIQATTVTLANFGTRRATSAGFVQAKDWIVAQLNAIGGYTVTTPSFSGIYGPNVVATKPGNGHPERLVVLGAHLDSINLSSSTGPAPGADDNASGSAALLETARILAGGDFENTVRLVWFSAEEFGLVGSDWDAEQLAGAGSQVVGMLNMDMVAYRMPGDGFDLDFTNNDTSAALTQFCRDVTALYVPTLPTKTGVLTAGTSDHRSYTQAGFPAAFFFEDLPHYSQVIHTANDVVGTSANDFTLAREITKAFVASAATLAEPRDLQMTHAPLADTPDPSGPYVLGATVQSLVGSSVTEVAVEYRLAGGAWQERPLLEGFATGEWVGSIPALTDAGTIEYRLHAADDQGHVATLPDGSGGAEPAYSFVVGAQQVLFADDFEGAGENGWTSVQVQTQNDWQKGTPQGAGGYDPSSAASGQNARGNDLGIGNFNGNYQANAINYLLSPAVDCSGASGVRLRFMRHLSVEDGLYDQAQVRVNDQVVWQNPVGAGGDHLIDAAWTAQDLDVSAQADGQPSVRVQFRLDADGGAQFGGWTVDDVALYSIAPAAGAAKPLAAGAAHLSAQGGGTIDFAIDAGLANAGQIYVLAMSATGTSPGTPLGSTVVPLQFDVVTDLGFQLLNTPAFQNFGGLLSAQGTAQATLFLPGLGLPQVAGLNLHLAFFTMNPFDFASNAVTVTFVP